MSNVPMGNCRRCGLGSRASFRICGQCKEVLQQLRHDLDILDRYKNEDFLKGPFDEHDMFGYANDRWAELTDKMKDLDPNSSEWIDLKNQRSQIREN